MQTAEDWKSKLHCVINEYPHQINFMQMRWHYFIDMPRKSLIQKGEKGKSGKISKKRLSVIFCSNATGKS
jgi:hypothetical protein